MLMDSQSIKQTYIYHAVLLLLALWSFTQLRHLCTNLFRRHSCWLFYIIAATGGWILGCGWDLFGWVVFSGRDIRYFQCVLVGGAFLFSGGTTHLRQALSTPRNSSNWPLLSRNIATRNACFSNGALRHCRCWSSAHDWNFGNWEGFSSDLKSFAAVSVVKWCVLCELPFEHFDYDRTSPKFSKILCNSLSCQFFRCLALPCARFLFIL